MSNHDEGNKAGVSLDRAGSDDLVGSKCVLMGHKACLMGTESAGWEWL
jgi:hypothetical protein